MPRGERNSKPKPRLNANEYKIGIICALEKEANAVHSSFDHVFLNREDCPKTVGGDDNSYSFGVICGHYVVLARIGGTGNVEAIDVAKDMYRSFQQIRICLLVGICGIVPQNKGREVFLGDIIMSKEVTYYTKGKQYPTGHQASPYQTEEMLAKAPKAVHRGFEQLCSPQHWKAFCKQVHENLKDIVNDEVIRQLEYKYPGREADFLYNPDYQHMHHDGTCKDCMEQKFCQTAADSSCHDIGCSKNQLIRRERTPYVTAPPATASALTEKLDPFCLPQIYVGKLASGDSVLKDGSIRDKVSRKHDVIAFEMEGTGVSFTFPTVVIKAGCDYADSHKEKQWQEWAAMTAASCAKAFLGQLQMGMASNVEFVADDTKFEKGLYKSISRRLNWDVNIIIRLLLGFFILLPLLRGLLSSEPGCSTDGAQFPDKTPKPVIYVPFNTVSGFVGRQYELESLKQKLLNRNSHRIASVVGLGGVGKSRLALEFTSFIQSKYTQHSIFWVQASNQLTFESDLFEIGKQLQIPEIQDRGADVTALVKNRLNNFDKWVLILDNADDELLWGRRSDPSRQQFSLVHSLPGTTNGSILVTTRSQQVASFLAMEEVIHLAAISEVEATELFTSKLQVKSLASDQDSLVTLVNKLTCLPLAIVQAASFVNMNPHLTARTYVELLDQPEPEVIKLLSKDFGDWSRYPDAKNPIATTWLISFEHISRDHQLAASLLSSMAWFHEKGIPVSLISVNESRVDIDMAIGVLVGYSFVTRQTKDQNLEQLYDLHRLVHLATRNWLKMEGKSSGWVKLCTERLDQLFPTRSHDNKDILTMYLPHAQRLLENDEKSESLESYNLLEKMGLCFVPDGKYGEAVRAHAAVVDWREENLGMSHPKTFHSWNNLGEALMYMGDFPQAEHYLKQATGSYLEVYGQTHPTTLTSMANLATTYSEQGRWEDAEQLQIQVLEIRMTRLNIEHPGVLDSISDLPFTQKEHCRQEVAAELQGPDLGIQYANPEAQYPAILFTMSDLASTYVKQGQLEKAAQLLEGLLKTRVELGYGNIHVLKDLTILVHIYRYEGQWSKAEQLCKQIVETEKKILGEDHPRTLVSIHDLALTYWHQDRFSEAEPLQELVLKKSKEKQGDDHPHTLTYTASLATTYSKLGRWEEAEQLQAQVLEKIEAKLGVDHPDTLTNKYNLASLYRDSGRPKEAITLLRQVVLLMTKKMGKEHPKTVVAQRTLLEWEAVNQA